MLDIIETEVTGPVGPTGWMEAAKCTGKSDLFFAPFAERPEARVRREAKARAICEGCEALEMCRRTHAPTANWASGVASRSRNGPTPASLRPHRLSVASGWPKSEPVPRWRRPPDRVRMGE